MLSGAQMVSASHSFLSQGGSPRYPSWMAQLLTVPNDPRHLVVIVGGAVAGSEAAALCADRGILAVVVEQNDRPYGKIEDGLPRWHDKLRAQEYERIAPNLHRPVVRSSAHQAVRTSPVDADARLGSTQSCSPARGANGRVCRRRVAPRSRL